MKNQVILVLTMVLCNLPSLVSSQVQVGAARTEQYYPLLKNRKVGILANHASVVNGANIVDQLIRDRIDVVRIFSPEHGFRLLADAGEHVGSDVDSATSIRVVSLYGNKKKPAKEDLTDCEIIVFDIQDVGVRFYTYISTLSYLMEACAEHHVPLIVLDRPNPNGFYVDGPVLEKKLASFVGMHPVPVVYGMTIGEYATMVNGEGWLPGGGQCDLTVIQMADYNRGNVYPLMVKPSPNLPGMNAVMLYPSLCLFEGTIVSVGRGTQFPFEVYGYPGYQGSRFFFTPESIPGMSKNPPYEGQQCFGVVLRNFFKENPVPAGSLNLSWIMDAYSRSNRQSGFFNSYFKLLAGTETLQNQIIRGVPEKKIRASWKPGIENFKLIRKKYLLY